MKIYIFLPVLITFMMSVTACNSSYVKDDIAKASTPSEILYVYANGKMKLDSRYVDSENVVIYSDGRGGEKAAIKVHFPLHSDFYRDSIIVVRVEDEFEHSVSQQESGDVNNIN